jgi:hypothetical protein
LCKVRPRALLDEIGGTDGLSGDPAVVARSLMALQLEDLEYVGVLIGSRDHL